MQSCLGFLVPKTFSFGTKVVARGDENGSRAAKMAEANHQRETTDVSEVDHQH